MSKANECRCWSHYPNQAHKEKCQYYECIKDTNGVTRKTVCKLKPDDNTNAEHILSVAKELKDYCGLHAEHECIGCIFKRPHTSMEYCRLADTDDYFSPCNFDLEGLEGDK